MCVCMFWTICVAVRKFCHNRSTCHSTETYTNVAHHFLSPALPRSWIWEQSTRFRLLYFSRTVCTHIIEHGHHRRPAKRGRKSEKEVNKVSDDETGRNKVDEKSFRLQCCDARSLWCFYWVCIGIGIATVGRLHANNFSVRLSSAKYVTESSEIM